MFKVTNKSKALFQIQRPDIGLNFNLKPGETSGYIHQRYFKEIEKYKEDIDLDFKIEEGAEDKADKDQYDREVAHAEYLDSLDLQNAEVLLEDAKNAKKKADEDLKKVTAEYDEVDERDQDKSRKEAEVKNSERAAEQAEKDVKAAEDKVARVKEANKKKSQEYKDRAKEAKENGAPVPPPETPADPNAAQLEAARIAADSAKAKEAEEAKAKEEKELAAKAKAEQDALNAAKNK